MAKQTEKKQPALKGVSAAERALAVLTAFRRGDGALSLAELAERTGLVKSTILRLALSLQQYRLLARLPDGSYRLDAETLRLGTAYQQAFRLSDHVMPVLEQLAAKTGETTSFYVRNGEERLCLFRVESTNRIRMTVQPGDTRPMDKSAIAQTLRRYESAVPGPDDELPLFTSGVTDPHAAALAMPVFGIGESLVGALSISGPVSRLTPERADQMKGTLVEAATKLTLACGGTPSTGIGKGARKRSNLTA
ncbi:IclR family transcriptional regulator [Bradyrhizobium sp. WSM2254]|uniref:IclR family transcriptional regulator n=1 Tax=Bradyrhizobium sp. WSM2254 TaxID=1188263 RepID=UPI00041865C9|nr:IclR family transcriptional regulator [Bradyrhizobium sp. WSM2254]